MNLVVFDKGAYVAPDRIRLGARHLRHFQSVLKAVPGDFLRVGEVNGFLGKGEILAFDPLGQWVELRVALCDPPPPDRSLALIIAMPRPLVFRRVLRHTVCLGVKKIAIVGADRVEKSYFHTPLLKPEAVEAILLEALEQAGDTQMPVWTLYPRIDLCLAAEPALSDPGYKKIIFHPGSEPRHGERSEAISPVLPSAKDCFAPLTMTIVAIGPEGGFTDREVLRFRAVGFEVAGLGPRILPVETAVCVALSQVI